MKNLSSTELKPLEFNLQAEPQKTFAPTNKIGWLHSLSDEPGARFDLAIKDGAGQLKFERKNCGSETKEFGELVNLPTLVGEELFVEVSNLRGSKSVTVFLN